MENNFLKVIKDGIMSEVERNFEITLSKSKEEGLDAITTLESINSTIVECLNSMKSVIKVDDEILSRIAQMKKPFVTEAKKQVAKEVASIIETESNVTEKITEYMNGLKKRGINLDDDRVNSEVEVKPIVKPTREHDLLEKEKLETLEERKRKLREELKRKESEEKERETREESERRARTLRIESTDCDPGYCGGGGGCGC